MRLKAKTHKGKNRIAQWGSEWKIIEERDSKFLIGSVIDASWDTCKLLPESARWVEKVNDPDFEIVS